MSDQADLELLRSMQRHPSNYSAPTTVVDVNDTEEGKK